MAEFVKAASLSELSPGSAKVVEVAGKTLALFNVGGTIYATTTRACSRAGRSAKVNSRVRSSFVPGTSGNTTSALARTSVMLSLNSRPTPCKLKVATSR